MPDSPTNGSLILMYHRIGGPIKRSIVRGQYTLPMVLRWQLRTLRTRGYTPLTLGALLARSEHYVGRYAATFDDGYAGVWRRAFPVLQEFQVAPTVFMVAGALGKTNFWDERIGDRREYMLSADELRALAAAGAEIGAHTMTHAHLPALSDRELRAELVDARHLLQDLFGQPINGFAYPYGEYDARVRAAVIDAGYQYAVVTNQAAINTRMDPFALTRVNMRWNTFGPEFTHKIRWVNKRTPLFDQPVEENGMGR